MKILGCGRRLARRSCQAVLCLMTTVGRRMGGGRCPFPGVAGRSLPVDITGAPVLPVEGPQSVPLQVAVVRVDGTIAGDTSGWKCPRDERDWRPLTGVSVNDGVAGSLSGGRRWPPRMLLEVSFRLCLLGDPPGWCCEPCWPDGPVLAGGPVGPCETQSPSFYNSLD